MKKDFPEIISYCRYMNFINYWEICSDVLNFVKNYQKSLLYGLKSIIFYDSVIYDNYQIDLGYSQVAYFSDKFKGIKFPSIHLYLYEIFGCTIDGKYKKNIFGKIKKILDLIYFYTYGKYFLIHRIFIGIIHHKKYYFNLNLNEYDIELMANDLYNEYRKNKGFKISKIASKISNMLYRIICFYRIQNSKIKWKRWDSFLKRGTPAINPMFKIITTEKCNDYDISEEEMLKIEEENYYISFGIESIYRKDMQQALSAFKKAISINPESYESYYNLGLIYEKLGEIDEAIGSFEKAIKINPNLRQAYNMMGVIYFLKKDMKKAVKYYKDALKINEKDPFIYYNLGLALAEEHLVKDAMDCLNLSIKFSKPEDSVCIKRAKNMINFLKKKSVEKQER